MEPSSLQPWLFPTLAALALGYLCKHLLSLVLARRTGAARALADYMAGSHAGERSDLLMGSRRYQIGLAFSTFGLDVSGHEETALYLAYGVVGLALWLPLFILHFPLAIWMAAPFLAYIAVNAVIDGKWTEMRLELEKELPTFLMRLASYLQTSPNLIQGLDEVAEGLDPQKPLKAWMQRLARELQAGGKAALERMQEEAGGISSSLLLAVVEIGRLWETGGQGYTLALKLAAENMAELLGTRAQAHAVAAGAWGTARTILLALALTLGVTLSNPISRPAMNMPLIQLALLFALVWAGIGYRQIKDLVDSVVE